MNSEQQQSQSELTPDERALKYTRQTTESYAAIGKFACEFELLCQQIRMSIWQCLIFWGIKREGLIWVIVADLTAAPLLKLLEGLHAETFKSLPNLAVEKIVSDKLLKEISELITERNKIIHGTYWIGFTNETQTEFDEIIGFKHKSNKSAGHHIESLPESKEEYEILSNKLENIRNLLTRLSAYIYPVKTRFDITKDKMFQEQGYLP